MCVTLRKILQNDNFFVLCFQFSKHWILWRIRKKEEKQESNNKRNDKTKNIYEL